jgi:cytochrome P450
LIKAEEAGDKLNEDELLAMVFLLLIAGHETTVNLIGNGTVALIENPNEMRRLQSEPSLIKPAVEELLFRPVTVSKKSNRPRLASSLSTTGQHTLCQGLKTWLVAQPVKHDVA